MQRFRGGLVSKARRLSESLNSRLESNKEETREVPWLHRQGYEPGHPLPTSIQNSAFWGLNSEFMVQVLGFRVQGLVVGVLGLGSRVQGLGLRVSGFSSQV